METPFGSSWHRYNHDGYGQRDDGGPYEGYGTGRVWPLLTGERGHYEVAAGKDASGYIRWMEGLATPTFLIPEQCWDEPDRPVSRLRFGRPTGSASPLLRAHAEYIRLLRSSRDGRVFDLIPEVAERYINKRPGDPLIQSWTFAAPATRIARGHTLRIMAKADFELTYSLDRWGQVERCKSVTPGVGIYFADIQVPKEHGPPITFTFLWSDSLKWENRNFSVEVTEPLVAKASIGIIAWIRRRPNARKRHQNKHLDFDPDCLRSRGSGVRISPGAPLFSSFSFRKSILYTNEAAMRIAF